MPGCIQGTGAHHPLPEPGSQPRCRLLPAWGGGGSLPPQLWQRPLRVPRAGREGSKDALVTRVMGGWIGMSLGLGLKNGREPPKKADLGG